MAKLDDTGVYQLKGDNWAYRYTITENGRKKDVRKARDEFGKYEMEIERYFDQGLCFSEYKYTQAQKSKSLSNVISVD